LAKFTEKNGNRTEKERKRTEKKGKIGEGHQNKKYFFILLTIFFYFVDLHLFSPSFPFFFRSISVLFSKFCQNLLKRTEIERK